MACTFLQGRCEANEGAFWPHPRRLTTARRRTNAMELPGPLNSVSVMERDVDENFFKCVISPPSKETSLT